MFTVDVHIFKEGFALIQGKKLLVVSAHAADYVWRSGGTIARYVAEGAAVRVVVLSLGIRGESNDLWKKPDQTEDTVRAERKKECLAAAAELGVTDIDIWDFRDYPMEFDEERRVRMVRVIREFRPDIIVSHDKGDIMNPDHTAVHHFVHACSVQSNSAGVRIDGTEVTKQMMIFGFEPHQTELSGFLPGMFVDITTGYEKKVAAMNCFQAQQHLIEIYKQRAFLRGNHARRLSGSNSCKYAECFARMFPAVAGEFV